MTRVVAILIVLALASSRATAGDAIVRGSIVKIEASEIYVDLGSDRGVIRGAALRLKRTVTLKHPITRAAISDWIPIGAARVTQAGQVLSRAVVGELVTDLRVGDIAEILVEGAPPAPASAAPAPIPPPNTDPQTAEVLALFAQQAGQPLAARIATWEKYLSTRPTSPYAESIRRDLDALHQLRDELRPPTVASDAAVVATVQHNAAASAPADAALPVVFVLDDPEHVASAYLHYRVRGARTYRSVLLVRQQDIYLRGAIPASAVQPPGVDYFVEVSTPAGRSGLALGSPTAPIAVDVSPPPLIDRFASTPGRSSVKLAAQYLDFATFDRRDGDHRDHLLLSTIDFTYRLADAVESLGVGYGVYSGTGGYADRTSTPEQPLPRDGFDYGYVDAEVGGRAGALHLSAGGQLIAGVGRAGFGLGVEGRFRIGDRDATSLLLSARTIDQVGFLSALRLGTRLADHLLFGVSVGATNQPNDGDIGVQLGTDVELVGNRSTSLLLRASWQGRSIDHGGLGGGAGLGVYW